MPPVIGSNTVALLQGSMFESPGRQKLFCVDIECSSHVCVVVVVFVLTPYF